MNGAYRLQLCKPPMANIRCLRRQVGQVHIRRCIASLGERHRQGFRTVEVISLLPRKQVKAFIGAHLESYGINSMARPICCSAGSTVLTINACWMRLSMHSLLHSINVAFTTRQHNSHWDIIPNCFLNLGNKVASHSVLETIPRPLRM